MLGDKIACMYVCMSLLKGRELLYDKMSFHDERCMYICSMYMYVSIHDGKAPYLPLDGSHSYYLFKTFSVMRCCLKNVIRFQK
jgi:hypothetical protein